MNRLKHLQSIALGVFAGGFLCLPVVEQVEAEISGKTMADFVASPPTITASASPLVMLTMSLDHQYFFKAYTDYDDLDGDRLADTTYNDDFSYYGYFNPNKCYIYDGSAGRFEPANYVDQAGSGASYGHKCNDGTGPWSGNFLNWATMSRMDVIRKVLYGGKRHVDSSTSTVLERAYLPSDDHAWAKFYAHSDLGDYTPYDTTSYPAGITMCNVTPADGGYNSEDNRQPPYLRIASGQWLEWNAQERHQCLWDSERDTPQNPSDSDKLLDAVVRVQVCEGPLSVSSSPTIATQTALEEPEKCKDYQGTLKPIGLLQRYGEDDQIFFGLLTGSYEKAKKGGVLRKNISSMSNETNADGTIDGTVNGVIQTLNAARISRYDYDSYGGSNGYGSTDNCPFGQSDDWADGACVNWGNPISEMYLESLRYFAGQNPTSNYDDNDSSWITGLSTETWQDPYDYDPTTTQGYPWCAKPNIVLISSGVSSYDHDNYDSAGGIPGISGVSDINSLVDEIAKQEGIINNQFFIGSKNGTGQWSDRCHSDTITALSDVTGVCPGAAGLRGSYRVAGLAHYAHKSTTDINDSEPSGEKQNINTYVVALSPPSPSIQVELPEGSGNYINILPVAYNWRNNNDMVIVNFRTIYQTATSGEFFMNYENSPAGADFDSDFHGYLRYSVEGERIKIGLFNTGSSAGSTMHMGYIIDGVVDAGTHYVASNQSITQTVHTSGGNYSDTLSEVEGWCGEHSYESEITDFTCTHDGRDRWGVKFHKSGQSPAGILKDPLWYAAKWGGFEDSNANDRPDQLSEWDEHDNRTDTSTPDGDPDNFFLVADPSLLEKRLNTVFVDILNRTSSGTAVAVIANGIQGTGAVYQALYEPSIKQAGREVRWTGTVHALWVDEMGHIREDGDGNQQLGDYSDDPVVEIYYDTTDKKTYFRRYSPNDPEDPGVIDLLTAPSTEQLDLKELQTLWDTRKRLTEVTDPVNQRLYSTSSTSQRHILTWLDDDYDNEVDSGEVKDFTATTFDSNVGWLDLVDSTTGKELVNYIRGQEFLDKRNRTIDYDGDGTVETLLLGDIVHSAPTLVGAPAEALDLVYGDNSYAAFRRHYANRRQVIYVGGNDGMIHAFNAGFYDAANKSFTEAGFNNETAYELGAELWAYVPKNVLGQLKYLNDPDYDHIYYMDGQPRVFDAKIFTPDSAHLQGWGTVMVVGMRLGGVPVTVDTAADGLNNNNADGNATDDVTLGSAYVVLDITNPEQPPDVLAEIRDDNLGFTTSFPSVVSIVDDANSLNEWFLVFGSGPTELSTATSNQNARFFVYDLNSLQFDRVHDVGIAGSFVGDPVTVDWDLDQRTDKVYFGLISGSAVNPGGELERIAVTGNADPSQWAFTTVVNPGHPFLARPVVSIDKPGNHWILAGTGRFLTDADKTSTDQQTLYGLMDDGSSNDPMVALSDLVDVSNAYVDENGDVAGSVAGLTTPDDARALQQHILNHKGWKKDLTFPSGESSIRQVNAAALLGGTLLVPAYQPDNSLCTAEGTSRLYALDFRSGVSSQALGVDNISSPTKYLEYVDLEAGLSSSPSLHLNATPGKLSKLSVFTQQSTGAIRDTDAIVAGGVRSGEISWREMIW
jgi:type IV pilus assembly protein PilY1